MRHPRDEQVQSLATVAATLGKNFLLTNLNKQTKSFELPEATVTSNASKLTHFTGILNVFCLSKISCINRKS